MSRNFTFTWNNYPDDCEAKLRALKGVKYAIYGRETGESGTPHLQGTIIFKSAHTLNRVIKKMPGCHLEVCKALHASIEYCKKDGDTVEWGIAPKSNKKIGEDEQERWRNIRLACMEDRLDDVDDKVRFNNYKACEHFRALGAETRELDDTEEKHLWYWGESRTGKSRAAREEHPLAYNKMANKWWNGYRDQDHVLIEDIGEHHNVLNYHLKIWADRYPFLAEHKGGARLIRPKKIIVTSNYHPSQIWFKDQELKPILERFDCKEFKKLKERDDTPYLPNTHDP